MTYLYIAIGVLSVALIVLLYRYIRLKSEIRKISGQLEELVSDNSEKMLDISLIKNSSALRAFLTNTMTSSVRSLRVLFRTRTS